MKRFEDSSVMASPGSEISLTDLSAQPPASSAAGEQKNVPTVTQSSVSFAAAPETTTTDSSSSGNASANGSCSAMNLTSIPAQSREAHISWSSVRHGFTICIKSCIAIIGLAAAWMAVELSIWTSAKDWKEYCSAQNVRLRGGRNLTSANLSCSKQIILHQRTARVP